jgi:molybdate transport system substrate-binding protein
MKKLSLFILLAFCAGANAGTAQPPATRLLVCAASSLKDAFTKIGADYMALHPDVHVDFNFAASGQLRFQIENGAPADIFASAAQADMDALDKKELLLKRSRKDFASNTLVLVQNSSSTIKLAGPQGLLQDPVKNVAAGNPDTVPAGRYAAQAMAYYKLSDSLKPKLVLGENVRQVLDYVARGEADAGFVFATDALTEPKVKTVFTVPNAAHAPIVYPLAIIKSSVQPKAAKAFEDYILSKKGRAVLTQYGFGK